MVGNATKCNRRRVRRIRARAHQRNFFPSFDIKNSPSSQFSGVLEVGLLKERLGSDLQTPCKSQNYTV